jgi:aminoglycoside N3'-acetyltransferase
MDRREFSDNLAALGVSKGDLVYVRAALGAVGKLSGDVFDVVVGGFQDAVGPQGTIMAPAFTKIGNVFSKTKFVFEKDTAPYSGAISKLFLKHPDAIRSNHPSHSFVAIGPKAQELMAAQGPFDSCFAPVKRFSELDGKMLLVGCNNDSPGFSTVHVAQFELGLSQRHWVRHLQKAWIHHNGKLEAWKPIESPGCSASFDKFYPAYIRDQNFSTGTLGQAYTLVVPSSRRALSSELEILRDNPGFVDCDRRNCLTCGFRGYQPWRAPFTLAAAAWTRLLRSN